jgi:intein/homing endonuclease
LENYGNLFEYTFNLKGSISKVKDKKCYQLEINSVELNNLFSLLKQNVYSYISKSPKEHIAAFIRGFADAEGYVDKKRKRITINQKYDMILRFIQLLLYRFNIQAVLERQFSRKKNKVTYNLRLDDSEALNFIKEIGLTAKDKLEITETWFDFKIGEKKILPIPRKELWDLIKSEGYCPSHFMEPKSNRFMTIKNVKLAIEKFKLAGIKNELNKKKAEFIETLLNSNITWNKVKKVNKLENKEVLYDINVPGQENYIANGFLVHNSTYRVYLRRGKKDTRVAKMVDAPQIPEVEAIFKVTEKGIEDAS